MFNLEATIQKIEAQVTDDDSRQAFLRALKARLAQMQHAAGEEANSNKLSEPAESSLQPQHTHGESDSPGAEPDSLLAESDSLKTEPASSQTESDPPATAKKFAAQLAQLDPELRRIASDLYEHLHHRSNFARLTVDQRDAILEMLKIHSAEKLAELLAQPPPIGMNLETSKAGLNRFRDDFLRCAMRRSKVEAERVAEQQRLEREQLFQKANASDASYRQITVAQLRKRLFHAAHDPASDDYHEIRWLIKSLTMLDKEATQ